MRPINRLISHLFHRDRPVRRWSDTEITTERDYLNSLKGTPEADTLEIQLRVAEYIMQRYYPRDKPLMESEFQSWILDAKKRMAASIAGQPVTPRSADPKFLAWMDTELGRKPDAS